MEQSKSVCIDCFSKLHKTFKGKSTRFILGNFKLSQCTFEGISSLCLLFFKSFYSLHLVGLSLFWSLFVIIIIIVIRNCCLSSTRSLIVVSSLGSHNSSALFSRRFVKNITNTGLNNLRFLFAQTHAHCNERNQSDCNAYVQLHVARSWLYCLSTLLVAVGICCG